MFVYVDGVRVQFLDLEGHHDSVEVPVTVAVVLVRVEEMVKVVRASTRQRDPHVEASGPVAVFHPVGTGYGRVGEKPIGYPVAPEYVEVLVRPSVLLENDESLTREERKKLDIEPNASLPFLVKQFCTVR